MSSSTSRKIDNAVIVGNCRLSLAVSETSVVFVRKLKHVLAVVASLVNAHQREVSDSSDFRANISCDHRAIEFPDSRRAPLNGRVILIRAIRVAGHLRSQK